MKKESFVFFIVLLSFVSSQNALCYDDQITHPKITEIAVQKSILKTVHRREDLDDLTTQVLNMKQGTQYYVPLAGNRAPRS